MFIIGECTEHEDHIITLLKSGKLLLQVMSGSSGMMELGEAALLRAIEQLSEKAEERMVQAFPTTHTKAVDMDDMQGFGVIPGDRMSLAL